MQYSDKFLGEEPIGKLLARLSIPAMVAMMVNALYNLVDTIFVGRGVGTLAIGGLTIAFPVQMFVMGVAMYVGMGSASIISRNLGAGNRERAYRTGGNALFLAVLCGLLMMVLGLIFLDPILRILGTTDDIFPYAKEYLSTVLYGTVFITLAMTSNNLIRAEGKAKTAMIVMIVGVGSNIILDPVFIFGFKMGIQGAALATVIAQFLSFLFVIGFYLSGRSALKIRLKHFKPAFSIQGEIFKLGFPVFVRQIGVSILAIIVNNSLRYYGSSIHIAAFGVVNRLMAFLLMPLLGISQRLQPSVGYNYGSGKSERVSEVLKKAIFYSSIIAVFSFLLLMFFPGFFLNLFSPDKALKAIGRPALRIIIIALPLFGLQIVGTMYFLAIGKAIPAMFLGLSRQVIFLIPFILLFPLFFGLKGVWISFPVADTLASLVTVLYLLWDRKKRLTELRQLPNTFSPS